MLDASSDIVARELEFMKPMMRTILLVACAFVAVNAPTCALAAQPEARSPVPCPTFTPLFGLMPFLMWLGVLPSPVMASSVTPSDTSTSIVIRPDPTDQITCGKTPIKTFKDVVFTTRTLSSGKPIDLLMDVQVPDTSGKKPLVIYVTGGGFIQAPKESAVNLRTYVAEAGFVVASVQYRTISNGANYRDGIADVKSAIRFLRAHANKYDVDSKRVALWGESAGGYLVAMAGVTNGVKTFDVGNDLEQPSDVQAVIDKFGASDTSRLAADFDSHAREANDAKDNPIAKYIGLDPESHRLDARVAATTANPLTYITSADPPFLIFHGSRDTLVSPSQTLILHNALTVAGAHSTRYVLEGAGHGDLSFLGDTKSGLPWSTRQTMGVIIDFLNASLGNSRN
jgi:acetyl esterase/lipase